MAAGHGGQAVWLSVLPLILVLGEFASLIVTETKSPPGPFQVPVGHLSSKAHGLRSCSICLHRQLSHHSSTCAMCQDLREALPKDACVLAPA